MKRKHRRAAELLAYALHCTNAEVAHYAGISKAQYSRWLHDLADLTQEQLECVARCLFTTLAKVAARVLFVDVLKAFGQ